MDKSRNAHFLRQHPPYVVFFAGSVKVDIKNLWEVKKKMKKGKKGVINKIKGNKIPGKETGNFTKVRVNDDFSPRFGKIRVV